MTKFIIEFSLNSRIISTVLRLP